MEICYPVQTCVAVEYAAVYVILIFHTTREGAAGDVAPVCHTALEGSVSDRSVVVFHCTTEGSARDFSWVVVFHVFLKDAVLYGAYVYHPVLEGAVLDGAFVSHVARKGAVLYGAVVFHFFISGEGTVLDGAPVFHFSIEGAFLDGAFVCHFSIEGAVGNCHIRLNLNRTLHRLCGTEIILSTRQSQCLGAVIVTPAGATARDFALVGSLRPAILHDEVGAGDCSVQHHVLVVRHGEFHGFLVNTVFVRTDGLVVQAEDFGIGGDGHFLRRGRGPLGHNNVGVPIRRHIVDFLDLGTGGHGDGVEICYPVQTCFAVEHATVYPPLIFHTAREGSTVDRSVVVCHFSRKGAVLDVAVVCHTARVLEGTTADSAQVCHTAPVLESTTADAVVVLHAALEGAFLDGSAVVHLALEGAAKDPS